MRVSFSVRILTSDPCSESLARYTFFEKFSNNPWMWATVISEFMFTAFVVGIADYWTPHLLIRSHSVIAAFNFNAITTKKRSCGHLCASSKSEIATASFLQKICGSLYVSIYQFIFHWSFVCIILCHFHSTGDCSKLYWRKQGWIVIF